MSTSRPAPRAGRRIDDDRLLDLAEGDSGGGGTVRLSHTTMAHLLGARRQSVTRVIAELRRQGLVPRRSGVTVVDDPVGLGGVMGPEPLP